MQNYNHEAQDLYLFALHTGGQLYNQRTAIEENLQRKYNAGKYDAEKAVKLWGYFADSAAKKYHRDMPATAKWFHQFTPAIRKEVARIAEIDHRELMNERAE